MSHFTTHTHTFLGNHHHHTPFMPTATNTLPGLSGHGNHHHHTPFMPTATNTLHTLSHHGGHLHTSADNIHSALLGHLMPHVHSNLAHSSLTHMIAEQNAAAHNVLKNHPVMTGAFKSCISNGAAGAVLGAATGGPIGAARGAIHGCATGAITSVVNSTLKN